MRRTWNRTVHMFPDFAGTVLWFVGLPVPYEVSGLPHELVADLRAWEAFYYAGLDDFKWRDPRLEEQYRTAGRALARRVARSLGDEFTVEVEGEDFRARGTAHNPTAVAAFVALAEEDQKNRDHVDDLVVNGAALEWRAYLPDEGRDSAS